MAITITNDIVIITNVIIFATRFKTKANIAFLYEPTKFNTNQLASI